MTRLKGFRNSSAFRFMFFYLGVPPHRAGAENVSKEFKRNKTTADLNSEINSAHLHEPHEAKSFKLKRRPHTKHFSTVRRKKISPTVTPVKETRPQKCLRSGHLTGSNSPGLTAAVKQRGRKWELQRPSARVYPSSFAPLLQRSTGGNVYSWRLITDVK